MIWTRRAAVGGLIPLLALPQLACAGRTKTIVRYRAAITVRAQDSIDRFRRLLNALAAQRSDVQIEFVLLPLPAALEKLRSGEIDMIVPFAAPGAGETVPAALATTPIMKGYQILYTNRARPLDPARLDGRRIEVTASMAASFAFPTLPSAGPEESFARLNAGEIDGYINAEGVADAALKRLGFRSIHRHLYREIEGFAMIGSGPRALEVEAFLTAAAKSAVTHPDFRMMQERTYGDWQPY